MKPVSTSTAGTFAQLKPVKSDRLTTPRSAAPVIRSTAPRNIRPARPLRA